MEAKKTDIYREAYQVFRSDLSRDAGEIEEKTGAPSGPRLFSEVKQTLNRIKTSSPNVMGDRGG